MPSAALQLRSALFQAFLSEIEEQIRRNVRDFVNTNLDRVKEARIHILKDTCEGDIKRRATQTMDQINAAKVKKALWKIDKGFNLGTGEKFLLFSISVPMFTAQEARKIGVAKKVVAAGFQKELRGKSIEQLTETQKLLMKAIPGNYFSDRMVITMRQNLPQD